MKTVEIDAKDLHYTPLNQQIRKAVNEGAKEITIRNLMGQRFIADGLKGEVSLLLHGVAGGDLGMFMSGPDITLYGNADHAPGNTMDAGSIAINGSAGDAVAHSMRGGKVFVRDTIGYRGGIHMKQYQDKRPVLVLGGSARSFLGEYMAGGLILVLRQFPDSMNEERGIGSGIHGGEIFIRGEIGDDCLGVGTKKDSCSREEINRITPLIHEFAEKFVIDPAPFLKSEYTRISPASARPFANKYTWE
jgi:glutamate synthase domain-containing protein 3